MTKPNPPLELAEEIASILVERGYFLPPTLDALPAALSIVIGCAVAGYDLKVPGCAEELIYLSERLIRKYAFADFSVLPEEAVN